jgi:hypothetical protein
VFDNLILFTAGSYSLTICVDLKCIFVRISVLPSSPVLLEYVGLGLIMTAGVSTSFCIQATDKAQNAATDVGVQFSVIYLQGIISSDISLVDKNFTNIERYRML